jgi:hypothetical protein
VHCIPNALELTLLRREDVWRWPMRIQSAREKAVRSATGHPNAGGNIAFGCVASGRDRRSQRRPVAGPPASRLRWVRRSFSGGGNPSERRSSVNSSEVRM